MFFLGFVGLYIYAHVADPHTHLESSSAYCPHVSLGDVKATVVKDWGGNVVFFNQAVPFFGGTISLAGDKTVSETGWDGCGTYFRIVKDTKRTDNWWTLMFSLWYPIIIFSVLPAVYVVQKPRGTKPVTA